MNISSKLPATYSLGIYWVTCFFKDFIPPLLLSFMTPFGAQLRFRHSQRSTQLWGWSSHLYCCREKAWTKFGIQKPTLVLLKYSPHGRRPHPPSVYSKTDMICHVLKGSEDQLKHFGCSTEDKDWFCMGWRCCQYRVCSGGHDTVAEESAVSHLLFRSASLTALTICQLVTGTFKKKKYYFSDILASLTKELFKNSTCSLGKL